MNVFAAPGGFILVARGMYELVGSDAELSAVLVTRSIMCAARRLQRHPQTGVGERRQGSCDERGDATGDAAAIGLAKRYAMNTAPRSYSRHSTATRNIGPMTRHRCTLLAPE